MEPGGNFSLSEKAAVIEANLRDDFYWKLVADFIGPQTGEGLDLDRELCKNRLLIQSGLMREDNNFPWSSLIAWLKRLFPSYHSADFRCLIERGIATTLSLTGEARQGFLESYVNFNFVGPICDSIGVERDHLLKMKDFSEQAQSIEVTNGLILELSNFVSRERVSPINLVTWLRNFNPEYCKDDKIQKAYKELKKKIKKLKMCYHSSDTRSHRRNIVMENMLQSPFELVKARDSQKTFVKKRSQSLPCDKTIVKEECDEYEISFSKESEKVSQVSECGGGENVGDTSDISAAKKEVFPSLLDVAMLSVQKLSRIHHGLTKECKKISLELLRNQYALTCKVHPAMQMFEKLLFSFHKEVTLASPVLFFHHNANFLVDMHDMVEQQIIAFENEIIQSRGAKLGRDCNPRFKKVINLPESATSRFIHMAPDMLTACKGALLNYSKHWVAFCKEKNNPSLLVRKPMTQFSSYFEAAAGVIHHHKEIALFFSDMLALNNDQVPNVLLESLVLDSSDPIIQSIACVLAIIYCKVVGPYWALLNSAGEYSLFSQYLLCLYQKFLEWSKDPSTLMVPDNVTNVFLQFPLHDNTYTGVYHYCNELHTNRDLIRVLLKKIIKVITSIAAKHLMDFLPGGCFSEVPSSDLNIKLLSCKFGVLMADYPYNQPLRKKRNGHPAYSDSSDELTSSDSDDTSEDPAPDANAEANWVKVRGRQNMGKRPVVKKVYEESMDLDYISATVERNGGPCRSQQDVDKLMLRVADLNRQGKREAIRCEILYQKMVLHNTDPILNSTFRTSTEMMMKLKLTLPRLKPGYSIVLAPTVNRKIKPIGPSMKEAASSDPTGVI
ncbi:uncharacterized protein LOC130910410 isoform X2 [Corythoichthys intestinalis]|nr:uncharacterized protein LOC130910410 isoform X2 [Corythoichthys intestinalis]XP_061808790.1 uncharacterized protein LOC133599918 [Nerophis lumbriciformis]